MTLLCYVAGSKTVHLTAAGRKTLCGLPISDIPFFVEPLSCDLCIREARRASDDLRTEEARGARADS